MEPSDQLQHSQEKPQIRFLTCIGQGGRRRQHRRQDQGKYNANERVTAHRAFRSSDRIKTT